MYKKTTKKEQRSPFDVSLHIPNDETRKAIDDVDSRSNLSRPFSSVAELMEDLYAED